MRPRTVTQMCFYTLLVCLLGVRLLPKVLGFDSVLFFSLPSLPLNL